MKPQLEDLQRKLSASRERLLALADRAAQIRARFDGGVPLGTALQSLSAEAARTAAPVREEPSREDGFFLDDGWEIALAGDGEVEGK